MNRAQQVIAMYEKDAPAMTKLGNDVLKQVDNFAKAQLKDLNPALKWEWSGHLPSAPQRISDNLEWELSVNSHSHGDELADAAKEWAESTLKSAVEDEFGESDYNVSVTVDDNTFPKKDDEKGDLRMVNIMLRLDTLKADGLAEARSTSTHLTEKGTSALKSIRNGIKDELAKFDRTLKWDDSSAKNTAIARKSGFTWKLDFYMEDNDPEVTPEYLAELKAWAQGRLTQFSSQMRRLLDIHCLASYNEIDIGDGSTMHEVTFRIYDLKQQGLTA